MCKGSHLYEFLDLGYSPLADAFRNPRDTNVTEILYPLSVLMCEDCGLAQLSCVVPAKDLYDEKYLYDCSVTMAGVNHWDEFVKSAVKEFSLPEGCLVVDIGSNVGVMLGQFQKLGMKICGFDPAPRIAEIARARGIPTRGEFFGIEGAQALRAEFGRARLITATNVFAHIHELDSFVQAVDILLEPGGALVLEFPYLLDLVQKLAYDTIYHEHLSYLSIRPLAKFLVSKNFVISRIVPQSIHGGSLRVSIGRSSETVASEEISRYIDDEIRAGLYDRAGLAQFSKRVQESQRELISLLTELKRQGKRIAAVSAPAKGMTLLNVCRIGSDLLDSISEKSDLKIGLHAPGIGIPIVSDAQLLALRPDYCLLLAWNFKDEIIRNLSEIGTWGGKFIIPLPHPFIVEP